MLCYIKVIVKSVLFLLNLFTQCLKFTACVLLFAGLHEYECIFVCLFVCLKKGTKKGNQRGDEFYTQVVCVFILIYMNLPNYIRHSFCF